MESIKGKRRERLEQRRELRHAAFKRVTAYSHLLELIFIQCLPTGVASPHHNRAPLNITHVCKYWREVAKHTPELWSSIKLKRVNLDQRTLESHIALLDHWILLSKNLPLIIHLHYRICEKGLHLGTPDETERAQSHICRRVVQVLEFVANHSQKLKELIVTTRRGLFFPVIRMLETAPVNLERCHLLPTKGEAFIFEGQFPLPIQFVNLIHCKKLQDLKFTCEPAAYITSIRSPLSLTSLEVLGSDLSFLRGLPVKSLKRLVLRHLPEQDGDGYPWRTIQSIPASFQGLTHLEITFAGRNPSMEGLTEDLTFPHLHSLKVKTRITSILSNGAAEAGEFFDHLFVPSLKVLRLDWHSTRTGNPVEWPHLENLIERSDTDLDTLFLNKVELTDDEVLPLLEYSPNLRVLFLCGRNLTGYLFECLTLYQEPDRRETNLCPYVRDLTLRLGKRPASEESLRKLVASRRDEYEDDPDSGVLLRFAFNILQQVNHDPIQRSDVERSRTRIIKPNEF